METDVGVGRRAWLIVVACATLATVVGSMSALYTSLADIAAETGASQAQVTWIVDSYTLALAAFVLVGGALGDRFGRRRALIFGLGVFTAATAIPLVVDSSEWVIASRATAGLGAALIMPSTLSLVTATFPEDRRNRAVGAWAGVAGVGSVTGLLGSGLLLEVSTWKSTFVAYTVIGAVLFAASLSVDESRARQNHRFDVTGGVLSAGAVGALVLALIEGPHRGWGEPLVILGFAVAAACTAGFILVELRAAHPLLDVRYFLRPGFAAGSLSVVLQFLVSFGLFLLLVQYLQLVRGYDPLGSALAIAPMIGPMLVLSVASPWFAPRLGLRTVTVVGLAVMGAGLWWFSHLTTGSSYTEILWPMLVLSSGMGLSAAPATSAIVADSPVDEHGVAAAVNDATREIGAAVGIAIAGSTVAGMYSDRVQPLLGQLPEQARGAVENSLAGAVEVAQAMGPAGQAVLGPARLAYTDGVSHSLLVLSLLVMAGAVVSVFLAPGKGYEPRG